MREAELIVLAHRPEFRLGQLVVRPSLRQLVHDDGREEGLEPRVMQALVALADGDGRVVTRDELIERCWEGRFVGEDAVNRVISRLRRLAEGIGAGSFRIETVTKVGYRLLVEAARTIQAETLELARPRGARRRALLAGSMLAAGLAAGAAVVWRWEVSRRPPPELAALLDQAGVAMLQGTAEGADQALGLLKRAVETRPDHADAWGMLAICYALGAEGRAPQFEADFAARAHQAAARAETLDPGNAYARVGAALLVPQLGRWGEVERGLRTVPAADPGGQPALLALAGLLGSVGRCREAAALMDQALALGPPAPGLVQLHALALWSAGRSEEADRAMAQAFALYPSQFAVWFTRFHLLLYTGRAQEALAQLQNLEGRPSGVPDADFALDELLARAMLSREPAMIARAVASAAEAARKGAGYAENAIQFAAAAGRPDEAFRVAEAYYFGRGFAVPDLRFSPQQRSYTRASDRRTHFLFHPSTATMRADARFAGLTDRLGLSRYWRETGAPPDYRNG